MTQLVNNNFGAQVPPPPQEVNYQNQNQPPTYQAGAAEQQNYEPQALNPNDDDAWGEFDTIDSTWFNAKDCPPTGAVCQILEFSAIKPDKWQGKKRVEIKIKILQCEKFQGEDKMLSMTMKQSSAVLSIAGQEISQQSAKRFYHGGGCIGKRFFVQPTDTNDKQHKQFLYLPIPVYMQPQEQGGEKAF